MFSFAKRIGGCFIRQLDRFAVECNDKLVQGVFLTHLRVQGNIFGQSASVFDAGIDLRSGIVNNKRYFFCAFPVCNLERMPALGKRRCVKLSADSRHFRFGNGKAYVHIRTHAGRITN